MGLGQLGLSEKVPVESCVPMMMFAIVFGLSVVYEVFLPGRSNWWTPRWLDRILPHLDPEGGWFRSGTSSMLRHPVYNE